MPMSAGYIPFHPNPSKPTYKPPPGAVDAHCHVFGPEAEFPFAPKRKYTPVRCAEGEAVRAARLSRFRQERDRAGDLSRHRQPGAGRRARKLERPRQGRRLRRRELHRRRPQGARPRRRQGRAVQLHQAAGRLDAQGRDAAHRRADRQADWHIVVYFEHADLDEMGPFLQSLPTTLVFDHMACPNVTRGRRRQALPELAQGARCRTRTGSPR